MGKTVLYIAASLDGKIARTDGSLDWLYALPNPNQIDHGYAEFLSHIGATVMGKTTYNEILGFGIDWPYREIESYVVTNDIHFTASTPNTYAVQPPLNDLINRVNEKTEKDIWLIGGGKLITSFLNEELIDRLILTLIPTIIGEGIPLFPDNPKESIWKLAKVEQFETGAVSLTYDKKVPEE